MTSSPHAPRAIFASHWRLTEAQGEMHLGENVSHFVHFRLLPTRHIGDLLFRSGGYVLGYVIILLGGPTVERVLQLLLMQRSESCVRPALGLSHSAQCCIGLEAGRLGCRSSFDFPYDICGASSPTPRLRGPTCRGWLFPWQAGLVSRASQS